MSPRWPAPISTRAAHWRPNGSRDSRGTSSASPSPPPTATSTARCRCRRQGCGYSDGLGAEPCASRTPGAQDVRILPDVPERQLELHDERDVVMVAPDEETPSPAVGRGSPMYFRS